MIGSKSSFALHCKTWLTDQAVYLYYIHCLLSWFNRHGSIPSNTQVKPLSICSDLDVVKGLTVPSGSKLRTTINHYNYLLCFILMEWMARIGNYLMLIYPSNLLKWLWFAISIYLHVFRLIAFPILVIIICHYHL